MIAHEAVIAIACSLNAKANYGYFEAKLRSKYDRSQTDLFDAVVF
jgi:hypothetical protein